MIVVVPLSLNLLQANNHRHPLRGDVIDHVLLISCFKALVAVTRERALILDFADDRHGWDAQRPLLHVGVVLAGMAIINVTKLDFKHGNDRAEQVVHESLLLGDQQRPSLQLGQRDVDQIDPRCHRIHDDPPLVRRHQVKPLVLGMLQERAAIQFVEV